MRVVVAKDAKLNAVGSALRSNPFHIGTGAVGASAGASQLPALERQRTPKQKRRVDVAAGTAGGAVGSQAAWLATGHTIRHQGHKVERERPEGMSRSQHQKIMRTHHHATGVPQNTKPDRAHAPKFYRTYPEGLPATKFKRSLGHMSGGRGAAIQSAVIGTGAVLGGAASARGKKQSVSKALYIKDERPSILRTAEMGVGLGLAAWGLGRSGMVGRALARGIRYSAGRDDASAVRALQLAQAAQGSLRRGTAPGERQLRRVKAINDAINQVPRSIRPEVATAAGVLLAANAHPVRRQSYRPVGITGHVGFR